MGFYIARYSWEGDAAWGVVMVDQIHPLHTQFESLQDLLIAGREEARKLVQNPPEGGLPVSQVTFLSPVTAPARILCQGINYIDHKEETGKKADSPGNLFFRKDESALNGANQPIVRPKGCRLLDYEIELGLVIGRSIRTAIDVQEEELGKYVAGLVMANDISARDYMLSTPFRQWYQGKSYRTFLPMGPYLYLMDPQESALIHNLDLKLWVNGEIRQNANTKDLIHKPAQAISDASRFTNLEVGDVLMTGTPGGVAINAPSRSARKWLGLVFSESAQAKLFIDKEASNPRYLQNGDRIKATIASPDGKIDLGTQENEVVDGP